MNEYKGYKVGDIVYYHLEGDDSLIGIILSIARKRITINWAWSENRYAIGKDILEFDDFNDLAYYFKKITEQEKLAILIKG